MSVFDGARARLAPDHATPASRETTRSSAIASAERLVCVAGPDVGRAFPLVGGLAVLVLGRGAEAHGLAATDVSRHHAQVLWGADGFVIEDLSSANGTFVNGRRVTTRSAIAVGDRIQLGGSTILVFAHHDDLEARMRQLQKLEAMEQAVGGLAHDFNNALTVIVAGLDFALEASDDLGLRGVLDEMRTAAAGASSMVRQLQHFGRRRAADLPHERVVLAPVVDEILAMARRVTAAPITYVADVAPALAARGARDELQQVLLNLCFNARDAMPDGGMVSVSARRVRLSAADAVARQLGAGGAFVEVVVADNGAGMSEAVLARAFEPFFTTKEPGKGTGLGLAMVHNIVRRHGGSIDVESTPGRGTTFAILLPDAG